MLTRDGNFFVTIKGIAVFFFVLYGVILPFAANDFVEENFVTSLVMMASCFVIAALLWSGRAVLLNILIAFYVFRVYLTRPYVDILLPHLNEDQLDYIYSNNFFYTTPAAEVVYLSLLSLLFAWLLGLLFAQPKEVRRVVPPWIFRQIDKVVMTGGWQFWVVWLLLSVLNFKTATEIWQGLAGGESSPLFMYGLFSMATINYVCLYVFLLPLKPGVMKPGLTFLAPVILYAAWGVVAGSRSVIFSCLVFSLSCWIFLNYGKRINRRDLLRAIFFAVCLPITVFAALVAQMLRSVLRSGKEFGAIRDTFLSGVDIFSQHNPLVNSLYFGLTELLHRLSSLQAQFMILTDNYAHDPWTYINPLSILMRIINDLVPGDVFDNLLTINQLYNYIYHDQLVLYNSETWGIQSTLYLYFGFWLSPFIVFWGAYGVGRYYLRVDAMAKMSPAFAVFLIFFFNDFIENGTIERIFVVDIVRPILSFFAVIILVRLLHVLFSKTQRAPFSCTSK